VNCLYLYLCIGVLCCEPPSDYISFALPLHKDQSENMRFMYPAMLQTTCLLIFAAVVAGNIDWARKYEADFGTLAADTHHVTATGKMVSEWEAPNWQNKTLFSQELTVWSNGYISPDGVSSPQEYEAARGGGWEELYVQRAITGNLTTMLQNVTDTSESDFPFVSFATFAPSTPMPISPQMFTRLMSMRDNVSPSPVACCCDGCEAVLAGALQYLREHTAYVQQFSVLSGDWVTFPTFIFGQRPDGTLVGVCSTEIST